MLQPFMTNNAVRISLPKDKASYPLTIDCPDGKVLECRYDGPRVTFVKGSLPYSAGVMALSDECGNLKHELEEIKVENSNLRREIAEMKKKLGKR